MRLCLVIEATSGGTGRHVIDLAGALCRRGHEVTIVYSPVRADAMFEQQAETCGARVVLFAMERSVGWRDLAASREFTRLVRRTGPFDVIHAHSSKAGAVMRLARVGTAARVYTPHAMATLDPDRGVASRLLLGLAERMLGPRTDALIAVSVAEWDEAGRLGIAACRRHLIANRLQAADLRPRNRVRDELSASDNEIWLGFVGRLAPQKAPLQFLAAVIAEMRRNPDVRALIIGDGEQAVLVEQAIAASEEAHRFVWKRQVDARDWLAGLDLLVVTSRFEGMPYAMLEALAAGVPILSTPVGGAHDLLSSGAGLIANNETLPGLLLALVADPPWLARLRDEAQRVGLACLDERMIDRIEALYMRLAARP